MQVVKELQRRNVIRVAIGYVVSSWLLLQVADLAIEHIGSPPWVMKTIMLVLALGFPVVLFFSWAYEVTPEGLKREVEVDRSASITPVTGQKLDRAIIVVVIMAVAYVVVEKYVLPGRLTPDTPEVAAQDAPLRVESQAASTETVVPDTDKSIAVLPFVNMSADESSVYFSDGLADTLLHMLAQVSELRVAARTSSFQFRDQTMDIARIGEQLNVGAILEGSVQKAGDKVRVTAQLIDVNTGYHLWSGNFDRKLDDIFRIQDEIANEVVTALKVSLLDQSSEPLVFEQTEDVGAYTEYLLAVDALASQNTDSLTSAVGHLQEAIRLDPNYAQAYATLGRTYLALDEYGMVVSDQAIPKAREAANRALDLSPRSVTAIAVLAEAERRDRNLEEAGQLFSRALSESPNDILSLRYYASYLAQERRIAEAEVIWRQIISLDPLYETSYIAFANLLLLQQRYAESSAVLAELDNINPDNPSAVSMAGAIEQVKGNLAAAMVLKKRAATLDPGDPELPFSVGRLYLALEMPTEASRWFDRAFEIDPEHPYSRATPLVLDYYLQRNPEDSFRLAIELLNDGIDNRGPARTIAMLIVIEHATKTGQIELALDTLDNLYPNLFDDPPEGLDKSISGTFMVGWALIQSGETDRGTHLLQTVRKFDKDFTEAFNLVRIMSLWTELLLDNKDGAAEMLADFGRTKHFDPIYPALIRHGSLLVPLRDKPAFKALLNEYQENAKEQRQILQAMTDEAQL